MPPVTSDRGRPGSAVKQEASFAAAGLRSARRLAQGPLALPSCPAPPMWPLTAVLADHAWNLKQRMPGIVPRLISRCRPRAAPLRHLCRPKRTPAGRSARGHLRSQSRLHHTKLLQLDLVVNLAPTSPASPFLTVTPCSPGSMNFDLGLNEEDREKGQAKRVSHFQ